MEKDYSIFKMVIISGLYNNIVKSIKLWELKSPLKILEIFY